MPKYSYRKLSGRINEKYGTRKAFAQAIGTSEVTVSGKMNGVTSFSQKDMKRWGDALEIPLEEYGVYFFA